MKIRIVEDDEAIRLLLQRIIEDDTHEVELVDLDFAANFAKLKQEAEWIGVDAVICDQMLGSGLTGIELLAYLKEHFPGIRRVMLSAMSQKEADPGGVSDVFLQKPASQKLIRKALGD